MDFSPSSRLIAFVGVFYILFAQFIVPAKANAFQSCLISALNGDASRAKFPGSASYQQNDVKPYNLYYNIVPAAVTYPKSTQEVSAVVKCAAQSNIKVQARSGGHSFGDYCLGGVSGQLVVDMKYLNQLSYNAADNTAHIGPGNHLKDVNDYMIKLGRKMPHGDAPQVGVGGHYTIGGLGRVSRMLGAATDQILQAQVVLADGSVVNASATQNSDLLFAIRGAGASFGIVTDFYVKTSPAPGELVAYTYNVTLGDTQLQANAFKAWQKLISNPNLTWKLSSQFIVFPFGCVVTGFYYGTEAEFSALNIQGELFGLNHDAIDVHFVSGIVAVGNELSQFGLEIFGGISAHFYSKSLPFTPKTLMSDSAVDAMFNYFKTASLGVDFLGIVWMVIFDLEGGAINQPAMDSAAFSFRDTLFYLQSYAFDISGFFGKQSRNYLNGLNAVVQKNTPGVYGAYPGYVDPYLTDGQQQYWRSNLPRLEQIKKKFDPSGLFSNPQSVKPASN